MLKTRMTSIGICRIARCSWCNRTYFNLHHINVHTSVLEEEAESRSCPIFPLGAHHLLLVDVQKRFLVVKSEKEPDESVEDGTADPEEEEVLVLDRDQGEGELDLGIKLLVFVKTKTKKTNANL